MQKVFEARVAAAGTMNSRLQMNLTKQERELKILQQMEEQYTKIDGVVATVPKVEPAKDPKDVKKLYEAELEYYELLKQQRILLGELRNDPVARLGAEKAFLEERLRLQKKYNAMLTEENKLFTKTEIENSALQIKVATKEFEIASDKQVMANKEAKIEIAKDDKDLYDKRLAEMKKWQKAYEQSLDDEAKKRKEVEDEKQRRIQATIELASTLTNGFTNLFTARIDNEITALNKKADEEIKLADGNQQKIDEINQKRAEKERELKIKAWKAESGPVS